MNITIETIELDSYSSWKFCKRSMLLATPIYRKRSTELIVFSKRQMLFLCFVLSAVDRSENQTNIKLSRVS